ncbi:MAG: hypothetical protein GY867_01090 [bacterium]|nr:hypothetical protein [bacterium]
MLLAPATFAQDLSGDQSGPCDRPESHQFDFWLDEWDLSWGDSGRGENVVTSELGECVIEENFTTPGGTPFIGNSISNYSAKTGKWHQPWVDNQGGHFVFEGGLVEDRMILGSEATDSTGKVFLLRMVFDDIEANSLDWRWERSDDGGQSWRVLWVIH